MRNILTVTVYTIILLTFTSAHCEVFRWKGDDGVVHYSDDPAIIPQKDRTKATIVTVESAGEVPNILGQWWNGRSSFSSFGYYFADKGRGFYLTGVSKIPPEKVPVKGSDFTWTIDRDGNITITPPPISTLGIVHGRYFKETEEICIYEKDNPDCSMTYTPARNNPRLSD